MVEYSVAECDRPALARSWCNAHYARWRRHGDPTAEEIMVRTYRPRGLSEEEAFKWFMSSDPPPTDECWDWPASTYRGGYGHFGMFLDGKMTMSRAHQISHRIFNPDDPVTEEKPYVLHSCDRPICVQPAHLRAGTEQENHDDAVARERVARGSRLPQTKLTEDQVLAIRHDIGTHQVVADRFGVSRELIGQIRRGKIWKHI